MAIANSYILPHAHAKQDCLLWNQAYLLAQRLDLHISDIHTVDSDNTFVRIKKPGDQIGERSLSCTARANKCDCLAWFDRNTDSVKCAGAVAISEHNVVKFDCTPDRFQLDSSGSVSDL